MDKTKETKPAEPTEVLKFETTRQVCIARFSPDGKYLCTGGYDAQIRRWEVDGESPVEMPPIVGHRGWVQAFAFRPQMDTLIAGDSFGRLAAWPYDEELPDPLWQVEAHDGWIRALAVSEDGKRIATAGRDQTVRVWDAESGEKLHEFAGHEYDVYSVAIHPGGESVVSGDLMGNLKHWDLTGDKLAAEICIESMHFYDRIQDVCGLRILRFHDDGKTLIAAGSDPTKAGRAFGIPSLHFLSWPSLDEQRVVRIGPDKNGYVFDIDWNPAGFFMLVTSGPPGAGKLLFLRPDADEPFYENSKMYNTHSLAFEPATRRLVVTATNRSSQGNGAVLNKDGSYRGNTSPLHFFELPEDFA